MTKAMLTALALIVSTTVMASEQEENLSTKPDPALVNSIYEFCSDQIISQEKVDAEKQILECVNTDLEISNYQTFKSYAELKSFIAKEQGN